MTKQDFRISFDWQPWAWRICAIILAALIFLMLMSVGRADGAGFILGPRPDTTRVTWITSRAATADIRATFLSASEPFTPKNGGSDEVYVAFPASSAEQRVGIIGWVESLPDSIAGTIEAATLTLTRLNSYDATGVNDSLEIAPVTVTWTEAQTSWLNRRLGRPWSTAGGDVDTSFAVRVRAGDIPNLTSGAADASVALDITRIVQAWKDGAVAFNGIRLAWLTGSSPVVRFHDNAAGQPYRPQIAIQSYTVQQQEIPRLDASMGRGPWLGGSVRGLRP